MHQSSHQISSILPEAFPEQFSFPPRHLYAMETYWIGQRVKELNRVANTFMLVPGESIGTFALERGSTRGHTSLEDSIELRMLVHDTGRRNP